LTRASDATVVPSISPRAHRLAAFLHTSCTGSCTERRVSRIRTGRAGGLRSCAGACTTSLRLRASASARADALACTTPTGSAATRYRTPPSAPPGLLVISGRPLTHCEVGIPKSEGPEEDRDEVLNPAMECSYGQCRRRDMGSSGVDKDTDQKVDRDENTPPTKERPDKVHPASSLRTPELRALAADKYSATS
jgi:hypothetical protein